MMPMPQLISETSMENKAVKAMAWRGVRGIRESRWMMRETGGETATT